MKVEGDGTRLCQNPCALVHLGEQLRRVHGLQVKPQHAGIGSRQQQQSLHQNGHALDLLQGALDDLAIRCRGARGAQRHFQFTLQDGQGRLQFVRSVGAELVHLAKRQVKAFEHGVQHAGEAVQFVAGAAFLKTLGQMLGTDAPRRFRHVLDRRQRPPRQRPTAARCQQQAKRQHRRHDPQEAAARGVQIFLRHAHLDDVAHPPPGEHRLSENTHRIIRQPVHRLVRLAPGSRVAPRLGAERQAA